MVDHEAMHRALTNALESASEYSCNSCGAEANDSYGEFVDMVTVKEVYKIWYCYDCLEIED
jgi:DNA-directed RNA polymerase beta' subunit